MIELVYSIRLAITPKTELIVACSDSMFALMSEDMNVMYINRRCLISSEDRSQH